MLMRHIKLAEIGVMLIAAIGFFLASPIFLILILFLMGVQSTFFGPVKYGILPQHLEEHELVGGNASVRGSPTLRGTRQVGDSAAWRVLSDGARLHSAV